MLMIFVLISFAGARCMQNFIKYLLNFCFTNKCLGSYLRREMILQNVFSNQPVNIVEILHYNSSTVYESDENELQFEKFFFSDLIHDLVHTDIIGYNQRNDMFVTKSYICLLHLRHNPRKTAPFLRTQHFSQ